MNRRFWTNGPFPITEDELKAALEAVIGEMSEAEYVAYCERLARRLSCEAGHAEHEFEPIYIPLPEIASRRAKEEYTRIRFAEACKHCFLVRELDASGRFVELGFEAGRERLALADDLSRKFAASEAKASTRKRPVGHRRKRRK